MALVGSYGSGATIITKMVSLLWGAITDKSPVRKVRGRSPERCRASRSWHQGDAQHRDVIALSGGRLRQARSRRA